ncbi:MAG: histidine kinase [Clostridiales bacterium]
MRYLFKIIFLGYVIVQLINGENLDSIKILILLLIVSVNIFKEKYCNKNIISILSFLLILIASYNEQHFWILLYIALFDFVYEKNLIAFLICIISSVYIGIQYDNLLNSVFFDLMCVLIAYHFKIRDDKNIEYIKSLDKERKLRYELEKTKMELINFTQKASNLAKVNERNRIAREIHDHVGHKMAGVLIQLQASKKVRKIDESKSDKMLNKSINQLADSLDLIRETVHKLKDSSKNGKEIIQEIIETFNFCKININYNGDINEISEYHFSIMSVNIKEFLTNSMKYSEATDINIEILSNKKITRLFMKDNGIGCNQIKDGLGLNGMKERISTCNGNISIDGSDGFMVVCILPKEEVSLVENYNS